MSGVTWFVADNDSDGDGSNDGAGDNYGKECWPGNLTRRNINTTGGRNGDFCRRFVCVSDVGYIFFGFGSVDLSSRIRYWSESLSFDGGIGSFGAVSIFGCAGCGVSQCG